MRQSGSDVMGITKFGKMKFRLKLRAAGIYCFSQQDQFMRKSTVCFNRCQCCICSWFLWSNRESRDLNESLVKTWAWLYLLNFRWHTCAYLMLTNPQFIKTAHSLTRTEPPETPYDRRHSWCYTGMKLYWNDTLMDRYDVGAGLW